jgi:hypothetical protein
MLGGGILSHVVGECCRCSTRRTTTALSGLSTTTKSTHIGVRPSKRFKGVIFTLEEAIEKAKNSADTPNTYYEINFMLNIDRKMNGQNLEGAHDLGIFFWKCKRWCEIPCLFFKIEKVAHPIYLPL